jgi:hypothetical protein
MLSASSGVEKWGLDEVWKEIHKIHRRFCKKILRILGHAATGGAKLKL